MPYPPSTGVLRQRLLSSLKLRHLKLIVEVADRGSLGKAAAALNTSQPAVSNALADLEQIVEAPLFIRHAKGMQATELGVQTIAAARRILVDIDRIAECAEALHHGAGGVVRIAATGGAITGFLTRALPAFSRLGSKLLLQIQEADPASLSALLTTGDIDLALTRRPRVVPAGWQFERLMSDRFVFVAGPRHPLALQKWVTVEDLRRQNWSQAPIDSVAMLAFEEIFGSRIPLVPALQISCRIPEILLAMLDATDQVSLVPFTVIRQYIDAGLLVELRVDHDIALEPVGMLQPDNWRSQASAEVARFLLEFAKTGDV